MTWTDVTPYLDKFRRIKTPEKLKKESTMSSIYINTKIQLKDDDIQIRNTTVFIKAGPVIKNEIFINKERILKTLKEEYKIKDITEIK